MKEKSPDELHRLLESRSDIALVDVREEHEHEAGNLGGTHIPLGTLMDEADRIPRDKPVVLYCRTGARSAAAVMQLESRLGFDNLYNLKGGILAYARAYDPGLLNF